MDERRIAEKRFGEIISDGFNLFGRSYINLILPLVLFILITIIIDTFLLVNLRWYSFSLSASVNISIDDILYGNITQEQYSQLLQSFLVELGIGLLGDIFGAVFTVLAMCLISNYAYKKYTLGDSDIKQDFKDAFNIRIIIPLLVLGLGVPIGFTLLWIPGIIIFVFFIFLVYTYSIKDVERPALEARLIAKGSRLKIIGIFLIPVVFMLIIGGIISLIWTVDSVSYISWHNPATRNYAMIFLYNIVNYIPEIIFAPLFICLLTPLYASQKAKKELGIPYGRRYYTQPTPEAYQPSPYHVSEPTWKSTIPSGIPQQGTGIFCPFCGDKVETPKKFCPNCGEDLTKIEF